MYRSGTSRSACTAIHTDQGDAQRLTAGLVFQLYVPIVAQRADDYPHTMTMIFTIYRRGPNRDWDEGATAVEAALVLSALMLLLFGIIEFGYALWQWNTMTLAVQDAGRYAMVNNQTCSASCAETQMRNVLTTAAVCTSPSAGQICV